jgi:cell division septal protein FtsQ
MKFWESHGMASRGTPARPRIRRRWLALSAAALASLAYVALWSGLFTITEVRFHGCGTIPKEHLTPIRASVVGKNLLTASFAGARARLHAIPEVRRAIFKRALPHTLDCFIVKREPVALLLAGDVLELDADGVIIPRRAGIGDVDLPVITGINQRELGRAQGRRGIDRAMTVLRLFKELGFSPAKQLSEIHIDGNDIDLVWMGTGTLILLGRDRYESRIRKLQMMIGVLSDREQFPELIDLRFDRQVVIR